MTVRLRPLRDDEVRGFIDGLYGEYVRGLVEDASMSREKAEDKATTDHASLFPGGSPQPDHHMYIVEDEAGEVVGHLFWARRPAGSTTRAFLYQIYIEEAFRGRGLGRQAMELLEAEVRADGLPGIDLNVWGGNDLARSLYRSLGFEERAVFMSKELA
ncbi:MAG: GNAT family N-acetyltransferase [Actinobacteria bacterium]|nr:MAG: GNAT family N-acetyltransferase [Actinomycetota bacterium]